MSSVRTVLLGDIASVNAGNSAPQGEEPFLGGTVPFIRTSDVGAVHVGELESARDLVNESASKNLKLFPAGSVLFPKSGASTFTNHRVLMRCDAHVASHLAVIKADESRALDEYLFYFLRTVDARDLVQDQGYPSLTLKAIAAIPVPLPSLSEQRRLVTRLDEALGEIEALRGNRGAKLKALDAMRASTLSELLRPREDSPSPGEWNTGSLFEVCVKIQDGAHRSPQVLHDEAGPNRFPYLTSKNVRNDGLMLEGVRYCEAEFHEEIFPRCNPELGDVLLTKDGANTGNVALNTLDEPFSLLSSVCLIKPDRSKLDARFLRYYLQSTEGRAEITGNMTGAAIPRIILKTIKSCRIPLPTLDEQERIVASLDDVTSAIDSGKEAATKQLELADVMTLSFMKQLLTQT